ncbi:SRPBCC domain-containing protein [Lysinibacillus agricola]|uniref:SRPBCC domain-containing protein n=1 Tax=Lysinibacillus agricola TaxID=2590012 RepID=A0ABX7B0H4_9BACI|nr:MULTISPECIES: SRPBCC domain-containing protein [Lysinibacillus]KOS62971.1 polyketide cyclase [Lysinibacillus sp. FJAT-14222]QQP13939.1 SRPBCC domain-containing protein [Lysinibacillus agricola]
MKDLKYQFYIAGTPEEVWKALISSESTKQIYYGSVIKSTFQLGDLLEYVGPGVDGDKTVHVYGNVLEYEPNKVLRFTHYPGKSYIEDDHAFESRISYLLEPIGSCTKLTVIQDQWKEGDSTYENSDKAWWMILSNTKTLVETGSTLDFGEGS